LSKEMLGADIFDGRALSDSTQFCTPLSFLASTASYRGL